MINPLKLLLAIAVYLTVVWHRRAFPTCQDEYIFIGTVSREQAILYNVRRANPAVYFTGGKIAELAPAPGTKFITRMRGLFKLVAHVASGKELSIGLVKKGDESNE